MADETLKIVSLEVSNVKRLKAVRVEPDGEPVITVCGRNGAGKSSLLDSIEMAFGGKAAAPPRPVREGEKSGRIDIDLGDYRVLRTFNASGRSALEVRNAEGAKFPSPQALLERFVGDISFDPLAFSRMPPKQQAELLRKLSGLDFTELDTERAELFAERTTRNREAKILAARVDGMNFYRDAPDEELSVTDLADRMTVAQEQASAIADHENRVRETVGAIERFKVEIANLEAKLKLNKDKLASLETRHAELGDVELPEPEDVSEIRETMDTVEETNRRVRANAQRAAEEARLEETTSMSTALTERIESIDAEKLAAIEGASLPVPGLVFGDDGVEVGGIPFEQLATSEQIRASVAIGLAMNPKLKVMLVRDGSLLDEDGKALVRELAEAADAQVWMECIGTNGHVSVLIEDGEVAQEAAT